jgi:hypothetical protein
LNTWRQHIVSRLSATGAEKQEKNMSIEQKGVLIGQIITHLKFHAQEHKKAFDEGNTFFSLAFKSDAELKRIAKLAGC